MEHYYSWVVITVAFFGVVLSLLGIGIARHHTNLGYGHWVALVGLIVLAGAWGQG